MSLLAVILASADGAGEHSKTPFYVFGGLLAGWAVLLAVLGITRPDFPGAALFQRLIMILGVGLVAGTLSAAVFTA